MARDVLKVVNWMMALPPDLERGLWQQVMGNNREAKMEWMCPIERIFFEDGEKSGLQKGISKGIEQGIRLGIERGRRDAMAEFLGRQLEARFGPLSDAMRRRLGKASPDQLTEWGAALLDASSLRQVFRKRP